MNKGLDHSGPAGVDFTCDVCKIQYYAGARYYRKGNSVLCASCAREKGWM